MGKKRFILALNNKSDLLGRGLVAALSFRRYIININFSSKTGLLI